MMILLVVLDDGYCAVLQYRWLVVLQYRWMCTGVLMVEETSSGDDRRLKAGAVTWRDLPLPLMSMLTATHGPGTMTSGSELAGRIDWIERRGTEIWGGGLVDLAMPAGAELARAMDAGMIRGVSVDMDAVTEDADGVFIAGRIMGATACPFPAFQEAQIALVASGGEDCDCELLETLVAAGGPIPAEAAARAWMPWTPTPTIEALSARVAELTVIAHDLRLKVEQMETERIVELGKRRPALAATFPPGPRRRRMNELAAAFRA